MKLTDRRPREALTGLLSLLLLGALLLGGCAPGAPPEDRSVAVPDGPLAALPLGADLAPAHLADARPEDFEAAPAPVHEPFVFDPGEAPLAAKAALVYDATAERELFAKNGDLRIPPASTAKILTALLVLELGDPDERFTVGSELDMTLPGSSRCWLRKGSSYTVNELLHGLMLCSGNDAAYVLAVHLGRKLSGQPKLGSKAACAYFCELMNGRAAELGALSSHFVSPEGWDYADTYTTVRDMCLITRAAMENPAFRELAACTDFRFTTPAGTFHHWRTNNGLLSPSSEYYLPEAIGGKTGTTDNARCCLVTAAAVNRHEIYVLVYGCPRNEERYTDTLRLCETYRRASLRSVFLLEPSED